MENVGSLFQVVFEEEGFRDLPLYLWDRNIFFVSLMVSFVFLLLFLDDIAVAVCCVVLAALWPRTDTAESRPLCMTKKMAQWQEEETVSFFFEKKKKKKKKKKNISSP